MAKGYLKVFVYTARQTIPIEAAEVTVYDNGSIAASGITDSSGLAGPFEIEAPPLIESLSPGTKPPYTTVDLKIYSPGFLTGEYTGIRIFADREASENAELIPLPEGKRSAPLIYKGVYPW